VDEDNRQAWEHVPTLMLGCVYTVLCVCIQLLRACAWRCVYPSLCAHMYVAVVSRVRCMPGCQSVCLPAYVVMFRHLHPLKTATIDVPGRSHTSIHAEATWMASGAHTVLVGCVTSLCVCVASVSLGLGS